MNQIVNTTIPRLFDSIFGNKSPFFLGFETFDNGWYDAVSQSIGATYPPVNVRKIDDNKYVIEVALAGFGKQDVEVNLDGSILTIEAKIRSEETDEKDSYVYKGIASRAFKRSFTLNDKVEIKNADFINGLLRIFYDVVAVDQTKKKIDIK